MLSSRGKFRFTSGFRSALVGVLVVLFLSGCAGFAKGVTEAVIGNREAEVDTRQCYVHGRAFDGVETYLRNQEDAVAANAGHRVFKVLMVHGIGSHQPGYSTRLAENLARALSLSQVEETYKEFQPVSPGLPGTPGILRATRYLSTQKHKEMIFFELTWDPIIEAEKQTIAFDSSGEYAFRRTAINNSLKLFVNETIPDVVLYYGENRERIQASVAQSLCWMMSKTWEALPSQGSAVCDPKSVDSLSQLQDDYAFITHSLGSRITTDALQRIAIITKADSSLSDRVKVLQKKMFPVFMLSNQLPLLQLGQPNPEVYGQIEDICHDNAIRTDERLFKETKLIAFSDPNDLFSYALPRHYLNQYMDSRLCPTLTNVIINVAPLTKLFGLGEIANPMAAHTEYDNDKRVIDLIARGIGNKDVSPLVKERCEWLEALPATK